MLERGGKAILYRPLSNYSYGNLDTVHDMLTHDATIVGLGDGGAHVGVLYDRVRSATCLPTGRVIARAAETAAAWAVKRLTHVPQRQSDLAIVVWSRLAIRPTST